MWRVIAVALLLLTACTRPEPSGHCRPALGVFPAGELNGPPLCVVGFKWKLPLNPQKVNR